jgi:hypothetical protein
MPDLSLVTAADLKARYPVFKDATDALVNALLDEARGEVGPKWIEADQKPALLAYAAYLLSNELALQSSTISLGTGGAASAVTGAIQEIWVGDVKAKFAQSDSSGGSGGGDGSSTLNPSAAIFLNQFNRLYRRSFPAVLVV